MKKIAIIDSQTGYWKEVTDVLSSQEYQIVVFDSLHSTHQFLASDNIIFLVINSTLSDTNSIELTWALRQKPNAPEVLIIADAPNADEAEQAIRSGAWEYLVRPPTAKLILPLLKRIIEYSAIPKRENILVRREETLLEGIAGESPKIKACLTLAQQAAQSDANVLIQGETGTGKDLLAWAIHKNSPRANNNFVIVDCAALPETLVESTLLGYERGAFTGADKVQDGLIKQADSGTLFLDEVGELPLTIQKSFLRVLEERRFRRVGGKEEIASDFRLLSASNKNLDILVQEGKFREDLLFRLRSFMIEIPSLRVRKEDIKSIIKFHLPRLCKRIGIDVIKVSDEFYEALMNYSWPGNVRELVNALDRSIVAARDESMLFPQHLPIYLRVYLAREKVTVQQPPFVSLEKGNGKSLKPLQDVRYSVIAHTEQEYLRTLMHDFHGDITEACRISGLSRSRLYSLLKKHKIDLP